jgi:hypothetical protein
MTKIQVSGRAVTVRTKLPGDRSLSVMIKLAGDSLLFEVWGRPHGERWYHAWPSAFLGDDFLNPVEDTIMRWGLEELATQTVNCRLDPDTMGDIIATVQILLGAAAGDPIDDVAAA